MDKILVSVLIPVYNAEKYLEKCIKSVTNQSLKNMEIIIINDGSTDKTLEILEKLKRNDSRINIITQENKGVSIARNNALKHVKGEYILWLDSDDWIEKGLEEVYIKAKQEEADIVVLDYWREEENKIFYNEDKINENNIKYINSIFCGKSTVYLWNKLIKTSLYKENKIEFPENIKCGEDLAVLVRLIYYSSKIIKVNKAFYHYVFNSNSISKKKYKEEEIFFKVLPDYLCQIENLEKFFYDKKEVDISILKIRTALNYFLKCDGFNKPIFILKKENNKIIKYLIEGSKDIKLKNYSFLDKKIKVLLKGLKFFKNKYFIVVIFFINKIIKFFIQRRKI